MKTTRRRGQLVGAGLTVLMGSAVVDRALQVMVDDAVILSRCAGDAFERATATLCLAAGP